MNEPKSEDHLLEEFLDGILPAERYPDLADRIASDPELATRFGEELQFAELLRAALGSGTEASSESIEAARDTFALSGDELIERACDGEISRAGCDRLAVHLAENESEVRGFRRRLAEDEWIREAASEAKSEDAFLEALETRMWAQTRRDHFVENFEARLDREIAEHEREADPDNVVAFPGPSRWQLLRMSATAAAVAIGAFFLSQAMAERIARTPSVASVVKSSPDVKWGGEGAPGRDGAIAPGRYDLESGVVALRFESGAELTVEGPARFEVEPDEETFVYHGVALARASSEDGSPKIRSKGISVSRPVPLLGIDARSEHATEAIVFSGDGGVCLDRGGCRSLFEKEAVKADLTREKLFDIPYNPKPFSKAWALASGVVDNTGPVRIELPGTEIEPSEGESEVQVFVENESFRPDRDLEVDRVAAGQFAAAESNPGESLRTGENLRSYLLQVWPNEENPQGEVEASLTFDHPVVGVIFSSDRLTDSDDSVGTRVGRTDADFNRARGLDSDGDELLLSDDRRTLNLKFRGGNREVDQVRVLVSLR